MRRLVLSLLLLVGSAYGASRLDRFVLFLDDPPLAATAETGKEGARLAAGDRRQRIEASHGILKQALAQRKIQVIGESRTLLNAVYVFAPGMTEGDLRGLPGVVRVQRSRPLRRQMNRALDLVNARNAWTQVGGAANAGAGVRIAVLDTGIDQRHPSFQDSSLSVPAGFPKCAGSDCAYTNNKVIAARSYVNLLVLPENPQFSRPDDLSPRDRVGHGTAAAMIAAGVSTPAPVAAISGVAPKAFLGNYKVFGSPGVNDVTFDDVVVMALEDALADQMHIAVLALGFPAEWGPNDRGAVCDQTGTNPCDPWAYAVENAARAGLTVVVSAGNDADLALRYPALNSIHSPGTAPSAITVGATTNSHIFFSSLQVTGSAVPNDLRRIPALFGDGPRPGSPLTAPLREVAAREPNGLACAPLGAGTLTGAIALIERGECSFAIKINNAQNAGAVAAVIMQHADSDFLFQVTGLKNTGIPAVMIGGTDAQALLSFIRSNADRPGTLDPQLDEFNAEADTVAFFSSRGPAIGENHIKPELAAVGTDLYVATQSYDPNGEMWDPGGFTSTTANGTSFAAAMVAGGAALVKQAFPAYGPAQLKSAVVNTAAGNLDDFDEDFNRIRAGVTAVGAGKLNAADAVRAVITVEPATLSFGVLGSGALPSRALALRNGSSAQVNLTLQVQPADARITLSSTSVSVGAGATQQVTVSVNQLPSAGSYEGFIVIAGGPVTLRVPYLYLRGDGVPYNVAPISGFDWVGNVGQRLPGDLLFKITDRFGVPVPGAPIQFQPASQVIEAVERTDDLGIAYAAVTVGPNPGEQLFTADTVQAPNLGIDFFGRARLLPAITQNGVVNAGSGQVGQGLAPGSYVSIFGRNLSESLRVFTTTYLPIALAGVSVSFDVPERLISAPGRIHFVSEGQINVQIPWELQGFNSARMKVSLGPTTESNLYSVPLHNHSPAFFEIGDLGGSGRQVIAARDEANQVISSTNPVPRGRVAQLFANGLGPVDNPPPSGEPAPATTLVYTQQQPTVTVGGANATVIFSGLTPQSIGLYQVNIIVPEGLQPGMREVVITIGGVSSKAAILYIG
ncbi:MAG: S8 family serine peptidase [Bryobacteraceae bacterium]|nr:S8 family serine peptidase [Bryobacteraceae bacterium]